jgi:hypothetical protein
MNGKIADVVRAYANDHIYIVRGTSRLTDNEFRTSKTPLAVRARTIVIKRLMADGFTATEVARFTGMKIGMIERRTHPKQRDRGNELRRLAYYAKKQTASEACV